MYILNLRRDNIYFINFDFCLYVTEIISSFASRSIFNKGHGRTFAKGTANDAREDRFFLQLSDDPRVDADNIIYFAAIRYYFHRVKKKKTALEIRNSRIMLHEKCIRIPHTSKRNRFTTCPSLFRKILLLRILLLP